MLWDSSNMTYEELISSLQTVIERLGDLVAEPKKVIVNSRYKDYGKEYLVEGDEYKTVFGIPLVFEDLGQVNFIVETDEVNPCDTCYIAQNYNLEDDDSPCLDCGEE